MYQKIVSNSSIFQSKKKCMKWYNLLFSITLGFVIPNSSNHCTRQRIFIMYSYICIMFIPACVRFLSVTPSMWPVFPPTTQRTPPHHTQSCRCRISVRPSCGQVRRSIVWQPLWFWHLPPCCKFGWNWMWVGVWVILWESFYQSLANGMNCKLE